MRPVPARDDKVVAAWNGLAISALVRAGLALGNDEWVQAATAVADLLVSVHLGADSEYPTRLVRVSRDGVAGTHAHGVLDDQATVAKAFLDVAQATAENSWLELAHTLLLDIKEHFIEGSMLSDVADDVPAVTDALTNRGVDPTDNVTPSGWSSAIDAALAYSALTGDPTWRTWAEGFIDPILKLASSHARFTGFGAATLVRWLDGPREVAVAGPFDSDMVQLSFRATAPGAVVAWGLDMPLMKDRTRIADEDTAYVCRNHVCDAPTTSLEDLAKSLGVIVR
jgi:uncharacterized protein YyaL (SSP411 family)